MGVAVSAIARGTDESASVGSRVRKLRTERSMSLQDLSRRSGVSVGMLSQIERDIANPSLKTLTKIQGALGVGAAAMFPASSAPPDPTHPGFVRRKAERVFCELGSLTKELLSTGATQSLDMMLLHIPPNGSSGSGDLTSMSEKGGLVLEGEVVIKVGSEEVRIFEGDSFIFDGRKPHSFRNDTDVEARLLWIICNFPMERHL